MERQVGLPRDQVRGRRVGEILPIVEPFWYEQLGRVVGSGQSEHFERYSAGPGPLGQVVAYVLNHPNRAWQDHPPEYHRAQAGRGPADLSGRVVGERP